MYGLYSKGPQSAANIRRTIKQYKGGNIEELHFKNDVRKQEQTKPDSQRNVKSVKRMVAVKPEKKILFLNETTKKETNKEIVFWLQIPPEITLKNSAKHIFHLIPTLILPRIWTACPLSWKRPHW
jgi:hypothetical protein